MHQWRRVDGVQVMIYALGLAMSGKNPTMPPRNSSELASDSVLSKMLAASACMVCRGGGVRRGGWKPAQSARLHAHTSRAIDSAALLAKSVPSPAEVLRGSLKSDSKE